MSELEDTILNNVPEKLRTAVWNELYEINRLSRYYGEVLRIHKRIDLVLRVITIILAGSIPIWYLTSESVILQLVSIGSFLTSYILEIAVNGVKVKPLNQARKGCIAVESMFSDLWEMLESPNPMDEQSIQFRLSQIRKTKDTIVTAMIVESKIGENKKLNIKCAQDAKDDMINLYHGARA